jgi:hypothetical protein
MVRMRTPTTTDVNVLRAIDSALSGTGLHVETFCSRSKSAPGAFPVYARDIRAVLTMLKGQGYKAIKTRTEFAPLTVWHYPDAVRPLFADAKRGEELLVLAYHKLYELWTRRLKAKWVGEYPTRYAWTHICAYEATYAEDYSPAPYAPPSLDELQAVWAQKRTYKGPRSRRHQ